MSLITTRKNMLTKHIFEWAKTALPALSQTEREALEAGDVWWDAELFSGNPDWSKLLKTSAPRLSQEEQEFFDGPTEELCHMLDEWQINWELRDLPPQVWDFIKKNKFFAMILPKKYGGLAFSAYAHSQIIRKIASRSVVGAVTVMVPNSLGPGELLLQFGTDAQRDYWLPRLATAEEIPCFGLTSPQAGSDAASMVDRGEICKGLHEGKETLGIRLNWHKRYITLGPIATVLGLAFKLYDPDHLLGEETELGITVALVPTSLPGIEIGHRHIPAFQMFQNGPNWGRDVFIPLDYIIGGKDQIGKGWKMLMSALAAGRGISLPSLSAAGAAFTAHTTGAYARIREQFGISIGKFEGIQERLARLAATAYAVDAARRLTCAALDEGHKLAVISAIMKARATDDMRQSVTDAMDVHAGKAVIDGPSNYLGSFYRALPVGITVEGANILTEAMIIFGQGSIRCHPWILKEMLALEEKDPEKALHDFDAAFWGHVGHSIRNWGRAWLRNWTGGLFAPAPEAASASTRGYYRQLQRYAAAFALLADMLILTLGGNLKRKESLSSRMGHILSEMYFLSAVLKRWEDDGQKQEDLPLVKYCMQRGFSTIEALYAAVLKNMPARFAAIMVKFFTQPFGPCHRGPSDKLVGECAEILLSPSETRERMTADLYHTKEGKGVAQLEKAFTLVIATAEIHDRMKKNKMNNIENALKTGMITSDEALKMKTAADAVFAAIAVDDFDPQDLKR